MGAELGEGKHTVVRECAASGLGNVAYKTIKDRHNLHARLLGFSGIFHFFSWMSRTGIHSMHYLEVPLWMR